MLETEINENPKPTEKFEKVINTKKDRRIVQYSIGQGILNFNEVYKVLYLACF